MEKQVHIHESDGNCDCYYQWLKEKCYACDKPLQGTESPFRAYTSDENGGYFVGPECFKKIERAGMAGYQPPKGGPRLYLTQPGNPS